MPYGFPQDLALLLRYSLNNRIDVRYRLSALPKIAPFLGRYWYNSAAIRHAAIARAYSPLIEHSVSEHNILIDEAKAADLIVKNGWMEAYRTAERRDADYAFAERLSREHGISHTKLDAEELATAEPHLSRNFAGGLKWNDPWSVRDPHALTLAYVKLFESLGGTLCPGRCLHPQPDDKRLDSAYRDGAVEAEQAVVALGPWADAVTEGWAIASRLASSAAIICIMRRRKAQSLTTG